MAIKSEGRQILIHGLALVLFGLLWESAVPHTPLPLLALGAHIQSLLNEMLFMLMALLILAIAAKQVAITGGALWQELIVKLTHIGAGIGLIVAWMLLIAGFVRKPAVQS